MKENNLFKKLPLLCVFWHGLVNKNKESTLMLIAIKQIYSNLICKQWIKDFLNTGH